MTQPIQSLNTLKKLFTLPAKLQLMAKKTMAIALIIGFSGSLFGQDVERAQITNLCGPFGVYGLLIFHTNPGTCGSVPAFDFTWNGTAYSMPSASSADGGSCRQSLTGLACSGGVPVETLPATVVISNGPMAGTYMFDASGNLMPVPVELMKFQSDINNNAIDLTWSTASELNNMGFEVQRSQNGSEWEGVGFVEGNGTTVLKQKYSFTDEAPRYGNNYYRLKQIDFNGVSNYSPIVNEIMAANTASKTQIYPNPMQDVFAIQFEELEDLNARVMVFNALGQLVREVQFTNHSLNQNISLEGLADGTYMVSIKQHNSIENHTIIKQQY